MGKAAAIAALLVVLFVCGYLGAALVYRLVCDSRARRWALARRRARWEPHTEMSRDCADDGTPIALVTVRLMARWGRRSEELDYQLVATVPVHEVAEPALLDAQGKAIQAAEVRNGIRAAEQ